MVCQGFGFWHHNNAPRNDFFLQSLGTVTPEGIVTNIIFNDKSRGIYGCKTPPISKTHPDQRNKKLGVN